MKPTTIRKRMLYTASQHLLSKQLGSHLAKDLKDKYHCKSLRVVEGDGVKVLRGEFKGIEGKVTKVSTEKRGIAIEGIKREKLKGGNVDIYIHPSNVIITSLNLEDKWRQSRLEGQKPNATKSTPTETKEAKPKEAKPKEVKPKEQKEASKEKPKEVKKETKADDKKDKSKTEKKGTK